MKNLYLKALVLSLLFFSNHKTNAQTMYTQYDVGVFYMPFWHYPGSDPMQGNWKLINDYDTFLAGKGLSYLSRKPLPNYSPSPDWYDEKMASVTSKQFELMRNNQIDFVVIDSYWNYYSNGYYSGSYQQVLENLIEPGFDFHGMEFAIMWANDFMKAVDPVTGGGCQRYLRGGPNDGLDAMISYWSQFINHPNYKKIDGKPVFYILYPSMEAGKKTYDNGITANDNIEGICTYCKADPFFAPLGTNANDPDQRTKFLLERIEQLVGQELYFVAVMTPDAFPKGEDGGTTGNNYWKWLLNHPKNAGYDAITSYGYKYFNQADAWLDNPVTLCSGVSSYNNWNYNYTTMQGVYSDFYDYILPSLSEYGGLKYQVPVSAGWNQGPLGYARKEYGYPGDPAYAHPCNDYSTDPLDQAIATPSSFEQSLINARDVANANFAKTNNVIMISAWNEYAEGTVVEPNERWGGQFLQKVKDVFEETLNPPFSMANSSPNLTTISSPVNTDQIFNIFPNPISSNYSINFKLSKPGNVRASLYTKEGKLVNKVLQENMNAGFHYKDADVNGLPPGIYYFILEAEGKKEMKKVIIETK